MIRSSNTYIYFNSSVMTFEFYYEYDALYRKLGNILSDPWKSYEYTSENNYLLGNNYAANQFTYDSHGNMLSMPHLSSMVWDYKDRLLSAGNVTFTSYYNYDSEGNRSRKVIEKQGGIKEERYYIGNYEIYKITGSLDDHERSTVKINDDTKVFALVEEKTNEPKIVRYQFDNHLGSACLELDKNANIISYEEYHPFGTTSYRSGRLQTEVSLKRYKYCGKERDEETGLYYYGARYYAGWLCRFVSVDPLQHEYPELTPFQYASNRPISGIDLDGLEWVSKVDDIGNMVISVNVTFENNTHWSEEEINEYKNAISTEFNNMLKDSFGDNYSGFVTFNGGDEDIIGQIIPSISLYADKHPEGLTDDNLVVAGSNLFSATAINTYNKDNSKKDSSTLALDVVHELLHTLKVEHPFETTQNDDTRLIKVGLNDYETTLSTSPDIYYNIMNYGAISINGQNLKSMWENNKPNKLTKGQLDFMLNEIDLQMQGAGKTNMLEYWQLPPTGESVRKQY